MALPHRRVAQDRRSKSAASVRVDNNPFEDLVMKNSNSNRIIDRTINIFRNYMRQEAIMSQRTGRRMR